MKQLQIIPHVSVRAEQEINCTKTVFFVHRFAPLNSDNNQYYLPHMPYQNHVDNQIASVLHRVSRKMPTPAVSEKDNFKRYVRAFVRKYVPQIDDTQLIDTATWLKKTKYSGVRKADLARLRAAAQFLDAEMKKSKSFIKTEGYPGFKFPRGINSPSDTSKAVLGAICHQVDKQLFAMTDDYGRRWYIKGTDPRSWPRTMKQMFGEEKVVETDFKSFEAHHNEHFAWVWKYVVLHVLAKTTATGYFKRLLASMVMGTNETRYKHITAKMVKRLMSGVMWTSSANGFLNLMIMSYLSSKAAHPDWTPEQWADTVSDNFVGIVEGDDGLCIDRGVCQADIDALGVKLEFNVHENFGMAKFCCIRCDLETCQVILDPEKTLRNFFVLPVCAGSMRTSKQDSYLRAKAMSLAVLGSQAPIIWCLAKRVLDATRSIDVSLGMAALTQFQRDIVALDNAPWLHLKPPSPEARVTLWKHFPRWEPSYQLYVEAQLLNGNDFHMSFWEPGPHMAPRAGLYQNPTWVPIPFIEKIRREGLNRQMRFASVEDRRCIGVAVPPDESAQLFGT